MHMALCCRNCTSITLDFQCAPLSLSILNILYGAVNFAVEAPGAESRKGSLGVGGVPMGASPAQTRLQAGNREHLCPHCASDLLPNIIVMQFLGSIEILHIRLVLTKIVNDHGSLLKSLTTQCCFNDAHHATDCGLLIQHCDLLVRSDATWVSTPFSENSMTWSADLHEGRRQVHLECDGPVANADMRAGQYPDDELEDYVDTAPISWAPTFPAFLAPAAMGLPFPTQPAALGMPPIPPPPKPRGFPAAAESGCAQQVMEDRKIPTRGGQKRKHQDNSEGGKRLKVSGGAARTVQPGSTKPPTLEGLSGGTAGAEQQGSAPANAMQESAALDTDVAAAEATGGEASTAKQGSDPAPNVCWGWNPKPSQLDAAADAMRATTLMLQQQQQQK